MDFFVKTLSNFNKLYFYSHKFTIFTTVNWRIGKILVFSYLLLSRPVYEDSNIRMGSVTFCRSKVNVKE